MKSSSHGRFTSAIFTPFRSTLNLTFIVMLLITAAFTFATPGVSIKEIFSGHVSGHARSTPIQSVVTKPVAPATLDAAPQTLPYAEDFSSLAHSSTTYPAGWQGSQIGTGLSAGASGAFKTTEPASDLSLTANGSASSTAGAVHNYNGKIGALSTGSADPSIGLAVDTTGYAGVTITFDVMTIRNPYNGTTNTRINEVDLQYRICAALPCSGAFASASNTPGIYQNNTTAQTSGTTPQKSETKMIELPGAAANQANVQLRWVQRDVSGGGSRPSFAVDNVSVIGLTGCTAPAITLEPANQAVTYGDAAVSFTSMASGEPVPAVQWEVDTGSGFVALANGGDVTGADSTTLTISNPSVAISGNQYRAVFTNECGGTQIVMSSAATVTVDPREVVIAPDPGQTKVYGDADPALTYGHTPPLIGSDTFSGELGRSPGENVGSYEITLGSLALSSNYILSFSPGVMFDIGPKPLVASITAEDRIYDGTTAATFSCMLTGVIGTDDVTCLGGTAVFAHRNVGTHVVSATGLTLSGGSAFNYTANTDAGDTAEISARPITVTAVTDGKIYDGTTASSAVPVVSTGSIVSGDSGDFSQTFDTKHAGGGKTLTPAGSVSDGNSGGNYAITFTGVATGVITQRPVTVTAVAATKAFDGNISSAGVPTVAPELAGGDAPNFFQTYDTPDAGTGKTLTPAGIANDGNAGANYAYTFVPVNTGVITAGYCFEGFHSPIGGSVESGNGGTFAEPVRSFKLNSTIPIKFTLFAGGCSGSPIVTGIHTLQMIKYANAVDSEPAIDATPTDAATTGNQFRLSDTEWVYNLDTKRTPGISSGTWLVRATLFDGSVKTAWISIKK
jgi:hypothetical protein